MPIFMSQAIMNSLYVWNEVFFVRIYNKNLISCIQHSNPQPNIEILNYLQSPLPQMITTSRSLSSSSNELSSSSDISSMKGRFSIESQVSGLNFLLPLFFSLVRSRTLHHFSFPDTSSILSSIDINRMSFRINTLTYLFPFEIKSIIYFKDCCLVILLGTELFPKSIFWTCVKIHNFIYQLKFTSFEFLQL